MLSNTIGSPGITKTDISVPLGTSTHRPKIGISGFPISNVPLPGTVSELYILSSAIRVFETRIPGKKTVTEILLADETIVLTMLVSIASWEKSFVDALSS